MRIGIGLDSHRLKPGTKKKLILGGVEISTDFYLIADSDGDVIIHSLCNALSTAIGGGSLDTWAGEMFKKGVTDSREFLKVVVDRVKKKGFKINNAAIMVEAGQPKLEGFRKQMQLSLAKLLDIEADKVGIAFTTGEGLTAFGKGKGIQAIVIVLVKKVRK